MDGYLREAIEEDRDLLFEWANEESVRKNSFTTKMITYEEHTAWFQKVLSSDDVAQYIYIFDGVPIGQVRVNIYNDRAEIGFSVCRKERGKGHGAKLLKLLQSKVREDYPFVKKLVGKVKTSNVSSQKAFLGVGYKEVYKSYELSMECITDNKDYMFAK